MVLVSEVGSWVSLTEDSNQQGLYQYKHPVSRSHLTMCVIVKPVTLFLLHALFIGVCLDSPVYYYETYSPVLVILLIIR